MRLSNSDLEAQVVSLKEGSIPARNRVVISHYPLALSLARKFSTKNPALHQEIVGLAMQVLTEKVEKIRLGEACIRDNNVSAYLNSSIVFAIRRFLHDSNKRRQREYLIAETLREHNKQVPQLVNNQAIENLMYDDIQQSSLFSKDEKEIVRYRLMGCSDAEIAMYLDCTPQNVWFLRTGLRDRLKEFI